jgi:hypothetical protein
MAILYVKVPAPAIQRGFVTTEDMGITGKQFVALMRAGICLKCIPDSDSLCVGIIT